MLTCVRYQRKALAMMLEKESGRIENTEFPSMWIPKVVQGGSTRSDSIHQDPAFNLLTNLLSLGTGTR